MARPTDHNTKAVEGRTCERCGGELLPIPAVPAPLMPQPGRGGAVSIPHEIPTLSRCGDCGAVHERGKAKE